MKITFKVIDEHGNEIRQYRDTVKNVLPANLENIKNSLYCMLDEYLKCLADFAWYSPQPEREGVDFYERYKFCKVVGEIEFSSGYTETFDNDIACEFHPTEIEFDGELIAVEVNAYVKNNPITYEVVGKDKLKNFRVQWNQQKNKWDVLGSNQTKNNSGFSELSGKDLSELKINRVTFQTLGFNNLSFIVEIDNRLYFIPRDGNPLGDDYLAGMKYDRIGVMKGSVIMAQLKFEPQAVETTGSALEAVTL